MNCNISVPWLLLQQDFCGVTDDVFVFQPLLPGGKFMVRNDKALDYSGHEYSVF